jgi:hypothetical protein
MMGQMEMERRRMKMKMPKLMMGKEQMEKKVKKK